MRRLLLALASLSPTLPAQDVWHVAPNGRVDGDATTASPLALDAAMRRLADGTAPPAEVRLAAGRYRFPAPFRLGKAASGTASRPLRILAAPGAEVVLRGAVALAADAATAPTTAERSRLAASAADRIVAWTVDDDAVHAHLSRRLVVGLSIDGELHLPARFPNEGYARLAAKTVQAEISPPAVPVGDEDYGVRAGHPPYREPGRAQGWLGSLDAPRGAKARIAARADEMAGTFTQWQRELQANPRRNQLTGFLDANWLQRSQPLAGADARTRSLHLSQALAYGWAWKKDDKPFCVFGLLCELDAPGEWHYDPASRRLFLYPPAPLTAATEIEVPVAAGFLHLDGCEHVHVAGLTIECVASGNVFQLAGRNNTVSGCTIRRSTACAVRLTGQDERVAGCDIVDCDHHVVLAGGQRGPGTLTTGGNVVDNCHLYQRRFGHRRVAVSISGVGNTLRRCLIHNSLGQSVTVRGNDHVLERNELCNIGFDEGDGGAIYAGGDLTGYGIVYRHNFVHHLMHVPGKVERSGIHLDDLQAGATCIGNVFYKSAGKGIFMNGGAGHVLRDNLFLNGYRGAYNVGHTAEKTWRTQNAIDADPQHGRRNTKENYVGRAERIVGPRGWAAEPWKSRYPRFFEVMEDAGRFGRLWPIRCEVLGNAYLDNDRGDRTIWSRVADEARAKSRIEGERRLSPEQFVDYDGLDLRFRNDAGDVPAIPFARIGLALDEHRHRMPDVAAFRRALREAFRGIGSMPGTRKRVDTAAMVEAVPIRARATSRTPRPRRDG